MSRFDVLTLYTNSKSMNIIKLRELTFYDCLIKGGILKREYHFMSNLFDDTYNSLDYSIFFKIVGFNTSSLPTQSN